ncbi:hypothetical protein TrLO_g3394 [Triparma laevis f. longispina]|uniref:C2H2-type domain-containing protein n=1 Tax=Triparma laevis f. longispina TaxID=1714387 RepID=A0A9W7AQH7_9STRA|nr:hypothetical protein TrLO_g3394 [Triparma laevis f. longispina]
MSADEEGGEGIKHQRLGFNGNDTPRSVHEDTSTNGPFDVANDDSVAGGADGDGVSARRKRPHNWIEGVERDKRGKIIRKFGIAWCQYETGHLVSMKYHKAAKHGINVVWFSFDQDNWDYKAKHPHNIKSHKQSIHNISAVWYQYDSCVYKSKHAHNIKIHKQHIHNIGVVWHQCDSCDHRAKHASNLKKHKQDIHDIDVVWHQCDSCDHKTKQPQ